MHRLAVAIFIAFVPLISIAQPILPEGFHLEPFVTELQYPTGFAFGPEGLLLIVEKSGMVRVARNGELRSRPFLDLSSDVNHYGDRGLTGIAIHPDFPRTPLVYFAYSFDPPGLTAAAGETDGPDGSGPRFSRVISVEADARTNFETASEGSVRVVFGRNASVEALENARGGSSTLCETNGTPLEDCLPSDSVAHGIGTIRFGPDGALYVGHGDASDPLILDPRSMRSQQLDSAAGKVFRLDPDDGLALVDNPYFDGNRHSNRSKVFAYGLRNPFRFTFHPGTRQLFTGDVGWNAWEEINAGSGRNFGWPCYEGDSVQPAFENLQETRELCAELYASSEATAPIYSYARPATGGALILGDFYNGSHYPANYRNALFFADYNDEWIRVAQQQTDGSWSIRPFGWSTGAIVQLSSGPAGDLYAVIIDRGEIARLAYDGQNRPPLVSLDASPECGPLPLEVQFSSAETSDPDGDPLDFRWDFGDGSSSNERNPVHRFMTEGTYEVTLTVTDAGGATGQRRLTVTAGSSLPSATIESPEEGTKVEVGSELSFSGRAIDPEDGEIEETSLEWELVLHHAGHVHPGWMSARGRAGRFTIADHGDDTFLELLLKATDSSGLTAIDRMIVQPRRAPLSIQSEPAGMSVVYESTARVAPFALDVAVGGERVVSAPAVQNHRSFSRWSDGGERSHRLRMPDHFQSLTVFYANVRPTARPKILSADVERPLVVRFDGSSSSDAEDDRLSFEWDFGDGTFSREIAPIHEYKAAGTYLVGLTVSDELGESDQRVLYVRVGPKQRNRPAGRS